MRERLYLYDTTLRDRQQTQGVQLSTTEKAQIAAAQNWLGGERITGGWTLANSTEQSQSAIQLAFIGSWSLPPIVNEPLIPKANPLKYHTPKCAPARDTAPKARP